MFQVHNFFMSFSRNFLNSRLDQKTIPLYSYIKYREINLELSVTKDSQIIFSASSFTRLSYFRLQVELRVYIPLFFIMPLAQNMSRSDPLRYFLNLKTYRLQYVGAYNKAYTLHLS